MSETASPQTAAMLFLHAQTSLHPGSGTALGTVDLPVQRERHTQWPLIPGSALKGILRDRCREAAKGNYGNDRKRANEEDADLTAVFGPGKVDESSAYAGALSVTDARILAFPVRSAKGVFAWVTCPAVLGRLARDLSLVSAAGVAAPNVDNSTDALSSAGSPLVLLPDKKIVLEEFEFSVVGDLPRSLADWIGDTAIAASDRFTPARIKSHLVILHDDYFTHFVRNATEVIARIGLDYEKKTVKSHALFYQEFLPAETLFYALVLANASRRSGHPKSAADVLDYLGEHVPDGSVLQIGGDETTGKGLCAVRLTRCHR
jgi:CRISPR-associated protein Cmr4